MQLPLPQMLLCSLMYHLWFHLKQTNKEYAQAFDFFTVCYLIILSENSKTNISLPRVHLFLESQLIFLLLDGVRSKISDFISHQPTSQMNVFILHMSHIKMMLSFFTVNKVKQHKTKQYLHLAFFFKQNVNIVLLQQTHKEQKLNTNLQSQKKPFKC